MSGYAEVNGARIYYEQAGEGRPLVMLHAGIADSRMWSDQVEYFAPYYTVITCDLRGFGKTAMPKGRYAHYRDLAGLLDTLGCDSVILMGCSMGGSAAIDFALEYPERVLALVLVSSALDGYRFEDDRTRDSWKQVDKAVGKKKYDKAADLEIEQWVVGSWRSSAKVDSSIIDLVHDMIVTHYDNKPDRGEEEGPDELAIDRIAQIKAPTLILTGDLDASDILNIASLLDKEIPDSKKISILDTAHLPNLEKPVAFNLLVYQFLRSKGL